MVSKAFWKPNKRAIPGLLVSFVYDMTSENLLALSPIYCCFRIQFDIS